MFNLKIFPSTLLFSALFLLPSPGCRRTEPPPPAQPAAAPLPPVAGFGEYWFQGKAELCTYDVEQQRYGETRKAEQVMIFVTEDFSATRHVKLDNPDKVPADRVPVLKLNAIRRFKTGIYDYSLMLSVFTPLDPGRHAHTLKATASIQDWCGQTFTQVDKVSKGFQVRYFSYFESESDGEVMIPAALLEDELWTRIRLNPASLPMGNVMISPSLFYYRLLHKPVMALPATLTVDQTGSNEALMRLSYQNINRQLEIRFEKSFPYKIIGWEERQENKILSKGTLKKNLQAPYWQQNAGSFENLRDTLQVKF